MPYLEIFYLFLSSSIVGYRLKDARKHMPKDFKCGLLFISTGITLLRRGLSGSISNFTDDKFVDKLKSLFYGSHYDNNP